MGKHQGAKDESRSHTVDPAVPDAARQQPDEVIEREVNTKYPLHYGAVQTKIESIRISKPYGYTKQ